MRASFRPSLLALLAASACAHEVHVKVDPAASNVVVGGVELGEVGPEGARVRVSPGIDPVPFTLERAGRIMRGEIVRDEVDLLLVGGAFGAALLCAPVLAAAGFCAANPGLLGASLACFLAQNFGACASALAAPGWLTVPCVTLGAAAGMSPLGLTLLAERPAETVTLPPGEPARAPTTGAMAW